MKKSKISICRKNQNFQFYEKIKNFNLLKKSKFSIFWKNQKFQFFMKISRISIFYEKIKNFNFLWKNQKYQFSGENKNFNLNKKSKILIL